MRPFQFHLKEHWRYPQSLDSLLPWTETISAHLDWWQNPTNVMRGADLGKKATHKCSRVEGGLSGPSKLQGPVSEPHSVSCNGQLKSGSLHKQTRRNSLSRDMHSPVEDHDTVPSVPDNIGGQTHFRVSECDGRPSVQVKPSTVNRMVTTSAGVPLDLSKVVHSSCSSI